MDNNLKEFWINDTLNQSVINNILKEPTIYDKNQKIITLYNKQWSVIF